MLIIRFILFLLVISVTTLPATAKSENNPELIPHTVKSASELDYPPFSIVQGDGTADGFSVELLKAVVHAVGLDISFEVAPWNEIKQNLINGHFDVLPLVSYSIERDRVLDFTTPYLRMHGTIFVRRGEKGIRGEADLKDKEILVMRGDTAHEYAVSKKLSNKLILTDTFEEAMKKLSDGEHDAVIIQQLAGFQLIKKLKISNIVDVGSFKETSLKPVAKPLSGFEQKFCFAVPEGHKELLSLLNEGLSLVIADDTFDELYHKWFGPILSQPSVSFAIIAKYLLFCLVPILFFIAIFGIWYLKREVAKKTRYLKDEISERKQREEELQKSEIRFQTLFENISDAVYVHDAKGRIHNVNRVAYERLGYTREEMLKLSAADVDIDHSTELSVQEEISPAITTGSLTVESRHKTKDGRIILVELNISAFQDYGKALFVTIARDITERKKFEELLISLERRNQALLDHSPVCHKIVDLDFNLQYMSANGFKMLKLDHNDEIYGKPYPFSFFPATFRNEMTKKMKRLKETGNTLTIEALTKDVEGNEVWLNSTLVPVLDEGEIDYITIVSHDVTQQKLDERDRKHLEEQLAQSQKMESIGNLAGGIAHDFNNLLYPIIGFAEMLKEDLPPDSPEYESVQEIFNAGKRGGELVKQILAFSRQSDHKLSPVRFQKILVEVLKLTRSTIPSDIEIHQDIQQDCGSVMAEATQLHQISMNLITNAYHAVENASGIISVQLKEISMDGDEFKDSPLKPGQHAMLSVSDNGFGIPRNVINNIFEPYFTTKEKGKGTGLGLAVVYGIVKEHKGDIKVYSEEGKGTTFNVYIPLIKKSTETVVNDPVSVLPTGTESLLLVDDEESVVRLGKQMLERLGYKVVAQSSSIDALELFKANPDDYDLVVTDMTMPKMTGDKLAKEILAVRSDMAVIICTGFSERINKEQAEVIGVSGFLMKPVVKSEMAQMVRKVLDETNG